jgi:hypothetical protein
MAFRGTRVRRALVFLGTTGVIGASILAPSAPAATTAPSADAITLAWSLLRDGKVHRLFESDPVARVRISHPEVRVVEVLVGTTKVEHLTVVNGVVDLPVAVPRVVQPGQAFSLTVRVTAHDGVQVERAFGPMTLERAVPADVSGLRWKWGSPQRVRLDWRTAGGSTAAAQFVVRRGTRVLVQLPRNVRFYRVATPCTAPTTYTVASVSADGVEGARVEAKIPAGSCPKR